MIKAENEIFDAWSQADVQKHLELTERFLRDFKEKTKIMKTGGEP